MNIKRNPAAIFITLFIFICYSCNKNNNNTVAVTGTTTIANIDSITGHYAGITSGDSIYTYLDSSGKLQQWVHSFSWQDTLNITSPDTSTITVASKYYTVSFPYTNALTISYINGTTLTTNIVTDLQNGVPAQYETLVDTTYGINHLIVNIGANYTKGITSNVILYSR